MERTRRTLLEAADRAPERLKRRPGGVRATLEIEAIRPPVTVGSAPTIRLASIEPEGGAIELEVAAGARAMMIVWITDGVRYSPDGW